ncbi:MAG: Gfo/Idh/MocA family oxidoreductase [Anaerolineae bacterium]|nr:Gfo/Idh/MocA family oxidoreductase [Anaerolineae bacterium]
MSQPPLRAALVGCGGMGKGLAQIVQGLPDYTLIAGCDLMDEQVRGFVEKFPAAKGYTDFARLLADEKPDVVIVATNNVSHAALTIQAAEAGARGVYCEKPMAANMADGRQMVEACRHHGTALVVNHQRRLLPVFVTMRRLITAGAVGDVELIRGGCAGDVLSDGTHTIDTIRHLVGDVDARWVFGQIFRTPPNPDEPRGQGYHASGGWRYGHAIESGAMAVIEFATGVRAEVFTGAMQPKGRRYQDFEVFGSKGRLHRAGDSAEPPLRILLNDAAGWQPVEVDAGIKAEALETSLQQFARMIHGGEPHPLSGDSGLKDLEIVMAIYESSRLRDRIELPLQQPRYPLDLILENP